MNSRIRISPKKPATPPLAEPLAVRQERAALLLGVSPKTVARWIGEGRIQAIGSKKHGVTLVTMSEIRRFLGIDSE